MRNRILGAILAVTAMAVVLFGLPLALAVQHLYHSEAVVRLEREAARATTHVPDSFATSGDPVELPAASDQTQLALYSADGRLVSGTGPAAVEAPVQAAFGGRVAEQTIDDRIVVAVPVADEERVVAVVRAALPASIVDARVRRAWLVMAALAAGAVAVAALVARAVAGHLSRPVDALAQAAARLGEGDFSVRAGRSGVPEVDAVASTLDAPVRALARSSPASGRSAPTHPTSSGRPWPGCACDWRRPGCYPGSTRGRPSPTPWPRWTGSRGLSSSCSPWPGTPAWPVTVSTCRG